MKFLNLVIVIATIFSCDKEDTTPQGRVTGEWQLFGRVVNRDTVPVTDCYKQSTFTFNSNGTFSKTTYLNQEECVLNDVETGSGTWEWIESFRYDLSYEGESNTRRKEISPSIKDSDILEIRTDDFDEEQNINLLIFDLYERKK